MRAAAMDISSNSTFAEGQLQSKAIKAHRILIKVAVVIRVRPRSAVFLTRRITVTAYDFPKR